MKIALIGYGKMGKTIEKKALARGHEIVLKSSHSSPIDTDTLKRADIAIEFTRPEAAVENINICFEFGIPVVVGTTGWLNSFEDVKNKCLKTNNSLFYSSNFSIGVNIFFNINKRLAGIMNSFPEYEVTVEETHHIHKIDAPSGTAISIANDIIDNMERKQKWVNKKHSLPDELSILSYRENEVPGTHIINYISDIDSISIKHEAFNRDGFALGAIIAAEWLRGKKGIYSMNDMLKF